MLVLYNNSPHIIKNFLFQETFWFVYFVTIETQTIYVSIFMVIGK